MRGARRVRIPYMRSCSEIRVYWGQIGIMEKEMETTIVYLWYMGIREKKMGKWKLLYHMGFFWRVRTNRKRNSLTACNVDMVRFPKPGFRTEPLAAILNSVKTTASENRFKT